MHRTRFRLIGLVVAALMLTGVAATSVSADTLLDQKQEVVGAASAPYVPNGANGTTTLSGEAQTFTAGVSGILHSIELHLYRVDPTTVGLTVELRDAVPGGTLLATSETVAATSITTSPAGAWVAVKFPTPATLAAGHTYAIVLPPGTNTASADPTYVWGLSTTDAYTAGTAWFYEAYTGPWTALPTGADHAFRTYVTTAAPTCDVALALVDSEDLVDDELSVLVGQKFEAWGTDYPPLTDVTVTLTPSSGTALTMPAKTDVYGDFFVEVAAFDAAKVGTWKVTAAPAAGCPATADFSNLVVKASRTVDRIFGADRYETAAKLSAANFPAGTANVFVATGALYPDALAGGPAAAWKDGPILLVRPTAIPTATRNELLRLKPTTIYLLGGPGAVSDAVKTQLAALTVGGQASSVVRIGGADRYETAALISKAVFPANAPAVLIATGQNYPDALAGAAAGARHGMPILLVRTNSIPAATSAELLRLHPGKIYVLGGTGVVSSALQTQLAQYTVAKNAADVVRLGGPTRYETAAAITDAFFPSGLSPVFIATGLNFPDALAAGPLGRAVLLVPGTSVPVAVGNEIRRIAPVDVHALGGPTVVSDGVLAVITSLFQ